MRASTPSTPILCHLHLLSLSRHVSGVMYGFHFHCFVILHECFCLPHHFLPYLGCSDLLLIRRGATRWGNLGLTTLFAEATSCQLGYKWFAKLTGRAQYYEKVPFPFSFRIPSIMDACMQVKRIMDVFHVVNATDGLFADGWFNNGTSLGSTPLFSFLPSSQLTNASPFHCSRDRRYRVRLLLEAIPLNRGPAH